MRIDLRPEDFETDSNQQVNAILDTLGNMLRLDTPAPVIEQREVSPSSAVPQTAIKSSDSDGFCGRLLVAPRSFAIWSEIVL